MAIDSAHYINIVSGVNYCYYVVVVFFTAVWLFFACSWSLLGMLKNIERLRVISPVTVGRDSIIKSRGRQTFTLYHFLCVSIMRYLCVYPFSPRTFSLHLIPYCSSVISPLLLYLYHVPPDAHSPYTLSPTILPLSQHPTSLASSPMLSPCCFMFLICHKF